MPIFSDLRAIDAYILNVTNPQIAKKAGELAVEAMNDTIAETVYANPSHMRLSNYDNTYGLMNRAFASSGKKYGNGVVNTGVEVEVSIDPKGDYPNMYGATRNNNDKIVEWLNYRSSGGYYNSRPVKPPNYLMFNKAKAKLIKGGLLKKTIVAFLKANRYVVSKSSSVSNDIE